MNVTRNSDIIYQALLELGQRNIVLDGIVESEEDFDKKFSAHPSSPTITWAQVQTKINELEAPIYQLRQMRNKKLRNTDQYTLPDFPHDSDEIRQAWLNYRQELRDLPANSPDAQIDLETGELTGVVWPTEPTN